MSTEATPALDIHLRLNKFLESGKESQRLEWDGCHIKAIAQKLWDLGWTDALFGQDYYDSFDTREGTRGRTICLVIDHEDGRRTRAHVTETCFMGAFTTMELQAL